MIAWVGMNSIYLLNLSCSQQFLEVKSSTPYSRRRQRRVQLVIVYEQQGSEEELSTTITISSAHWPVQKLF